MADDLIPPSFTPSQAKGDAGDAPAPPSFTPNRTRPQKPLTPSSEQTLSQTAVQQPLAANQPQSRPTRQIQGSTSHPASRSTPQRQVSNQPDHQAAPPINSLPSQGGFTSSAGNKPPRKASQKSTSSKVVKGIGIFIACLLVVILALGIWLYSWVNGQLIHFDALSNAPSGTAETWLILGSDVRDGTSGTGAVGSTDGDRTDTIMVLIKPSSGPAALISIPRDSYVVVDNVGMKINAVAETKGWPGLTSEVESLIGTKIDHVVKVGFAGVKDVVDALGGVNLCYNSNVNDKYSGLVWTAGCHNANGATALAFSRMRYADPRGDIGRADRQRQVIQAVATKAGSSQTLTNIPKTLSVVQALLKTIKVDQQTSPWTLLSMVQTFKAATSKDGITGTPYMTNLNYTPSAAVGSTVQLNDDANATLFDQLVNGTHKPGTVGGMKN